MNLRPALPICLAALVGCAATGIAEEPIYDWLYKRKIAMHAAQRGEFDEAAMKLDQSVLQAEARLGRMHPAQVSLLHDRVAVYRYLGRFADALDDARWALALARRSGNEEDRAASRAVLASVLIDLGDMDAARAALGEEPAGLDSTVLRQWFEALARLHQENGQPALQVTVLEKVLGTYSSDSAPESREAATLAMGAALLEAGQPGKAEALYQAVLDARNARLPDLHVDRAAALEGLARCRPAQAVQLRRQAENLRRRTLGPARWESLEYLLPAGLLYLEMGDAKKAAPLLAKVTRVHEKHQGKNHPATAAARFNLARAYEAMGKKKAALRERQAALSILEKSLGPDHPRTRAARATLQH